MWTKIDCIRRDEIEWPGADHYLKQIEVCDRPDGRIRVDLDTPSQPGESEVPGVSVELDISTALMLATALFAALNISPDREATPHA